MLEKAELGDLDAIFTVASAYELGTYEVGSPTVEVELNPGKAVAWFRAGAERGDTGAQLSLGNCLSEGRGCREDVGEALVWYRRALRKGCTAAANNIAIVYREMGNVRRYIYWLKRAHGLGDDDASVLLGKAYYTGKGVRANCTKAVELFRSVLKSPYISEHGRCEAMYWLGMACLEGKGRRRSATRAKYWYAKAASCHEPVKERLRQMSE
jgi:uncharacterized protein